MRQVVEALQKMPQTRVALACSREARRRRCHGATPRAELADRVCRPGVGRRQHGDMIGLLQSVLDDLPRVNGSAFATPATVHYRGH